MAYCRGCGAEIIWIENMYGKIPCNPKPVMYWEKEKAKGKVVTPNGQVISCEFSGDPSKATGMGYISHDSTCPVADRFRYPRRGK